MHLKLIVCEKTGTLKIEKDLEGLRDLTSSQLKWLRENIYGMFLSEIRKIEIDQKLVWRAPLHSNKSAEFRKIK
jgi:hypothetical protein